MTAGRSYRTNLEVLRDVLTAARFPAPKTRIIGLANLNPRSSRDYLRFCTTHELVAQTSQGYVATRRGEAVRDAIEGLLEKTAELEWAVHRLKRNVSAKAVPYGSNGAALHHISRWAWNELLLDRGNGSPSKSTVGGVRDERTAMYDSSPLRTEIVAVEHELDAAAETKGPRPLMRSSPSRRTSARNDSNPRPSR